MLVIPENLDLNQGQLGIQAAQKAFHNSKLHDNESRLLNRLNYERNSGAGSSAAQNLNHNSAS
jgi:hypothetical protein